MNIVITINLNGNAYQLEKSGYDALREYLESAARRLEGNPDRDEIIADIEQAIADKFRAVLGAFKTVVSTREVGEVIAEMGPVQDASAPADIPPPDAPGQPSGGEARAPGEPATGTKRLYKINDGAMLGGVCNGLAAYFNIDVTVIRILFTVLTVFTWGAGVLLYAVMVLLIPAAHTPAEKAAAYGASSTAEEFIRRAKAGYYEGLKTFHDRRAHREWKKKFKQEMRGWKRNFRREMHGNAFQWRQNWQQHWAQHSVPVPGAWFAVPFLTLLSVLLTMVGLFAVFSLVATGAVFGVMLPATVPLWVGVVVLLVAFNFLVWPLKAMRRSFYFHGIYGPGYAGPIAHLWHSFAWAALLVFVVWLANRHIPQVHVALEQLRPQVHHAIDSFRQWWDGR